MRGVRMSWPILPVAALTLVLATPAAALPAGRSGAYGGGAVRDYLQFVSAQVRPDGRFTARATLVTECAPRYGDSLTESVSVRDAELSADGRYAATTSFAHQLGRGVPTVGGLRAEGTIRFSMRVLAGGRAAGSVRVRTAYTDPRTGRELARCDTGRIAWAARRPSRYAGEGRAAAQAGTHRGTTAQAEPFLMRVTDRGRLVRRAGLIVKVDCPSAAGVALDVVAHRMRVRRGRFGGAGEFTRAFRRPDGTRLTERYHWIMRGRFGRHGARGDFELRGVVRRARDGERIGSCRTGTLAWRAVR